MRFWRTDERRQTAGRQAHRGHVGSDPRADRSGALHRQPLLRQARPRHRRGGGRGRRRCDAGFRAGEPARSARREHRQGRDRAATCSRPSRRRCRPTSRCSPPRWRTGACDSPTAKRSRRAGGGTPALALIENPDILASVAHDAKSGRRSGHWLRRRDRERRRARQGQARAQRLRLDRRQRRFAGHRRDGRRRNTVHLVTAQRGRILAAAIEGRRWHARSSRGSPTRSQETIK